MCCYLAVNSLCKLGEKRQETVSGLVVVKEVVVESV